MIPSEAQIERVMRETGMARMQAINHLRQREALASKAREIPRYWEPTFTLDRKIAHARAEMGEARWQELNAEWTGTDPQLVEQKR